MCNLKGCTVLDHALKTERSYKVKAFRKMGEVLVTVHTTVSEYQNVCQLIKMKMIFVSSNIDCFLFLLLVAEVLGLFRTERSLLDASHHAARKASDRDLAVVYRMQMFKSGFFNILTLKTL